MPGGISANHRKRAMARLKQKDFVVVEWVDSMNRGGWHDES